MRYISSLIAACGTMWALGIAEAQAPPDEDLNRDKRIEVDMQTTPPPAPEVREVVPPPPQQPMTTERQQIIVVQQAPPGVTRERAARERKCWESRAFSPCQVSLTVGGGVADFVTSSTRAQTDIGGSWDARLTVGTRSVIALEAGYMG